jgi:light-regulated signal transduction histidine kinase (bacteriophytochrome)
MQSFSYSISHDLRAPLRAINGFSKIVLAANAGKFDQETIDNLGRIAAGAERMGLLIDDLLNLSQISRRELRRQAVNLSALAGAVAKHLAQAHPQRRVEVLIAPAIMVEADRGLVQIVLENVIGNAWKFTARTDGARIEVGQLERDGETICFVRDNGAGFDMRYAGKLFGAFQRLHTPREFEGTGIGLSIVQRIVVKHGGRIWAEAKPGQGATLYFTLAPGMSPGMQAI